MKDIFDFSPALNSYFRIQHLAIKAGYDTPDHFVCPKGLRPWSRFFCLQSGVVHFETSDGKHLTVSEGDILYLPHNVSYVSGWTKSENGWYYSIEFILSSETESIITFSDNMQIISRGDDPSYAQIVQDMYTSWSNGVPGYWMHRCEQFLHFLQLLIRKHEHTSLDKSLIPIREGISYLENNYISDVTTAQLAKICRISESSFRRLFHHYSKFSPISYRNWLRMKHARELLETGLYSVSEAAAIVNITDLFYFNKMFKRYFGTAPSNVLPMETKKHNKRR